MSNWRIIGSTAAYHWFRDWRHPKDLDLLTPAKISGNRGDICVVDAQWHDLAQDIIDVNHDPVFLDPHLLYTLKLSHSYWDIHWDKTLYDTHQFQVRNIGFDQELHDRLVKMWTKVHGEKKVSMRQGVDTFWQDAVKRRYDHEWLHHQVKFHHLPLHTTLRPDPSSVYLPRSAFDTLAFDLQIDLCLEEILSTAIERADLSIQSKKSDRLSAFSRAHFLLCTSMAKGWFAQFMVQQAYQLKVTQRERWLNHLDHVLCSLPLKGSS